MEDKLLKVIKFKSYKDVIGYDLLFLFGLIFLSKIRYLMIALLVIFNIYFFSIKNYVLFELYEDRIYIPSKNTIIRRNNIINITKAIGKSGMSEIVIEYIDENGEEKMSKIESPDSPYICRCLKKYSET